MKYLLVLLVVLLVGWLLWRGRSRQAPVARATPADRDAAQAMVECRHCGVHLPRADALSDARGSFCSESHRLAGPRVS